MYILHPFDIFGTSFFWSKHKWINIPDCKSYYSNFFSILSFRCKSCIQVTLRENCFQPGAPENASWVLTFKKILILFWVSGRNRFLIWLLLRNAPRVQSSWLRGHLAAVFVTTACWWVGPKIMYTKMKQLIVWIQISACA